MLFPDGRDMIFADCAANQPDAGQLADIVRASEQSAKALLIALIWRCSRFQRVIGQRRKR